MSASASDPALVLLSGSVSAPTPDASRLGGAGPLLDFPGAPVVRLPEMALGQGFAWCAALRRLVDKQQPFVLVDEGTLSAGSEADLQIRRCWVQRNARALSTYCYGLIAIEPRVERRSETRTAAIASMSGASLRVLTVSSEGLAYQLAAVLLKAESSTDAGSGLSASSAKTLSTAAANGAAASTLGR